MSIMEVLLIAVAIASNIGVWVLAVFVFRLLHQERVQLTSGGHGGTDDLDPATRWRVQRLAAEWAASRRHPEAARLAEGYLRDAAAYAQRRSRRLR